MCYEVDLKYGGRETSEGSLVSCRSKDGMAWSANRYFHHPQPQTLLIKV